MVPVLMALGSAISWGTGDFLGGSAAKQSPVSSVAMTAQTTGLAVLAVVLISTPGRPDIASMLVGAAAGLAGGLALLVFYRSLATGSMSTVAPLAALTNSALPVLIGLWSGERPGLLGGTGVVVAIVAAVLVGAAGTGARRPQRFGFSHPVPAALLAGCLFGLFFVLISRSATTSGLWPLLGARLTSLGLIGSVSAITRRPLRPAASATAPAMTAGLLDMVANILFLCASRQGLLLITAVLAALYPVLTISLAGLVLHERPRRLQRVGLTLGALAVTCIALR